MGHLTDTKQAFFVTGTDTEMGKTFICQSLLDALNNNLAGELENLLNVEIVEPKKKKVTKKKLPKGTKVEYL